MEAWQTLVIALVAPATPGGLWVALRWWIQRRDALDKARHDHEDRMLSRFEAMQKSFLDELNKLEEARDKQRLEHLVDTKTYAASLAQVTAFLQKLPSSQRPPPER